MERLVTIPDDGYGKRYEVRQFKIGDFISVEDLEDDPYLAEICKESGETTIEAFRRLMARALAGFNGGSLLK